MLQVLPPRHKLLIYVLIFTKVCYLVTVRIPGFGNYLVKRDKYSKRYENLFSILYISCRKCSTRMLVYQKDGKQGFLKRCYLNRIILRNRGATPKTANLGTLDCPSCHAVIGKRILYKGRRAYAIVPNSYKRRTIIKNWSRGVKYKKR